MRYIVAILLFTLNTTFALSQDKESLTILSKERKIIYLDIEKMDLQYYMNTLNSGYYYLQKSFKGKVRECKIQITKKK